MAACKRVNKQAGGLETEYAPFDEDEIWDAPAVLTGKTRTIIQVYREGDDWSYVKHSCMHCQKASCVSVCPVKAMDKDPLTGIVKYNKDTCIGCRYCQVACPWSIPKFQWDKTNPQIVKCDMCASTNLKTKGVTACAEACSAGAIKYGRRGDLLEEAKKRLAAHPDRYIQHIYGEHEVGGTNHLYLSAQPFEKLSLPKLGTVPPSSVSEKIQHTIYKGFIAPIALYATLCFVAVRNMKVNKNGNGNGKKDVKSSEGGEA
jgi:Fe-S-cluster-containing dehydrogenase component